MTDYISHHILDIKKIDDLRFKEIKKNNYFDEWSFYAFQDIQLQPSKRSESGSFYTPEWIVTFMVEKALSHWIKINNKDLWNCKILEPTCGSGNYVEVLFKTIFDRLKAIHPEKKEKAIIHHIATNILYAWDVSPIAIETTIERIQKLFNVKLANCEVKNTLLQKETFDIIMGNPPYGNLLNKEDKKVFQDSYNNIALTFLAWSYDHLDRSGVVYFIVPHSFSRTGGGALTWRNKVIKNNSVFEIIDVGNPFFDIKLEQIIVGLSNQINNSIQTGSLRENFKGNLVPIEYFYTCKDKRMVIYWDTLYQKVQNLNLYYPFNGYRGKDISKNNLSSIALTDGKWHILGKNISKDKLKHIKKYDRYISSDLMENNYPDRMVAITQFGTTLKATILDSKLHYPSGGVVIVSHGELSQEKACEYLNLPFINHYLNRYILNNAKLTIHLDGKYLADIPFLNETLLKELQALSSKED